MKLIYLFAFSLLLFTSCETASNMNRASGWNYNGRSSADGKKAGDENPQPDRMVIYNAYLDLTVRRPDSVGKTLSAIAKKYQGFAQTIGTNRAVLRVKADMLYPALAEIGATGKVSNKSISADDVTDTYYDAKIRLENAQKARQKYIDLMQKAVNVQDMVAIEKELDRLNSEIDVLEGQMKRVENNVALSTITISIHERTQPGPIGYIFVGLYTVVKFLFVIN